MPFLAQANDPSPFPTIKIVDISPYRASIRSRPTSSAARRGRGGRRAAEKAQAAQSSTSPSAPPSPRAGGRAVLDGIVRLIPGWTRLPVGPESATRAVALPAG